jgi:poly(A)-specific ribonuclease
MEMGFSRVIQILIKAKKPIAGHNCMFDWMFVYHQFISKLPASFSAFAQDWNSLFPQTFDTKVLARHTGQFDKTSLGLLFKECENGKLSTAKPDIKFDLDNKFNAYHGTAALSHYHESAYDAYMTGVVLSSILNLMGKKAKQRADFTSIYAGQWCNQVMLDFWGSDRVYHLN